MKTIFIRTVTVIGLLAVPFVAHANDHVMPTHSIKAPTSSYALMNSVQPVLTKSAAVKTTRQIRRSAEPIPTKLMTDDTFYKSKCRASNQPSQALQSDAKAFYSKMAVISNSNSKSKIRYAEILDMCVSR